MDTRQRGRTLGPERFSDTVRRRLANLDRLREVWTERRCYGRSGNDPAVDRASARWRVETLRLLAGADNRPAETLAAEEDAFLAMAADCRSGVRLTPEYFEALAHGVPDFAPPLPAPSGIGEVLAEAAAVETHPVIRAAHLFLTCSDALESGPAGNPGADPVNGTPADTDGPPPHLRPLPWWLAALSLMRSDLPPPAIDRRCPPAPEPTAPAPPPPPGVAAPPGEPAPSPVGPPSAATVPAPRAADDRLTAFVLQLADLEAAALRWELSRPTRNPATARKDRGRLAAAVHRRIVEHLRVRCASLRLVLRELDPGSRAVVSSSTGGPAFTPPGGEDRVPGGSSSRGFFGGTTEPGGTGATPETSPSSAAAPSSGRTADEPTGDSATATTTKPARGPARDAVAPSPGERRDTAAQRALFTPGANEWQAALDVDLADGVLQLLVFVQEVGSAATGVLAVTADGRMTTDEGATDVLEPGCADCVTLVPTDGADDRWPEVEAFVDDVLSRSVGQLTQTAQY
ncbi:hypothetical protein GCM10027570_39150 [Streptomonospora sediminis]